MYEEINFPGRRANEKIIVFTRRHWIVFFFKTLIVLLIIFSMIGIYAAILLVFPNVKETEFYDLLVFAETLISVIVWCVFFGLWIDYYLDAWIVTDERIINIEQRGFFSRDISELKLIKIQDVTSEVTGIIPTLFNFGNVYVQTAGETERFIFRQIPNPNAVRNMIVKLQEVEEKEEQKELGEILRGKK